MNGNQTSTQNEGSIDLYVLICDIFRGAKKLKWILLLLICLGVSVNLLRLTVFRKPVYTSSVTFSVSTKVNYSEEDTSYSYNYSTTDPDRFSQIFPALISSDALKSDLIEDIGKSAASANISIDILKNSNLMELTVTSGDADLSYNVLNSAFTHLPEISKPVIGEAKYNVIQPAEKAVKPSNTPSLRNGALIGAAAGLVAGCAVVFVYSLTRKTIRKSSDINELFNLNCMSSVPKINIKRSSDPKKQRLDISNSNVGNAFREEFYSIALKLARNFSSDGGGKIFMFTSTISGEGKTLCAYNTAKALAENGKNVLLIDLDFYHPSVHRYIDDKSQLKGDVVDVLLGKYDEAYRVDDSRLYVLAKESPKDDNKRLLRLFNSNRLANFLCGLKKDWDYIILDTPPCTLISDSSSISEQCDGIIYVIRQDYAKQNQIADGIQSLTNYGTPIIGCIFNGVESSYTVNYNYYGKYGRYGGYGKYGNYGKYGAAESYGTDKHGGTDKRPAVKFKNGSVGVGAADKKD